MERTRQVAEEAGRDEEVSSCAYKEQQFWAVVIGASRREKVERDPVGTPYIESALY